MTGCADNEIMDIELIFELRAAMKSGLDPTLAQAFEDWAAYYCGNSSGFFDGLCTMFKKADPKNKFTLTHAYPMHSLVHRVVDRTGCGSLWAMLGVAPMQGLQDIFDRKLTLDQIMVSVEMHAQSMSVPEGK